LYLWKHSRKHL